MMILIVIHFGKEDKRFTCLFKIEEGNAQKPTYMTTEAQILITIGKKDYG